MSEDLNVFPNAKSKLLGDGEDSIGIVVTPAVAGLSGDNIVENTIVAITTPVSDDAVFFQQPAGSPSIIIETVNINPSTSINKVHVRASLHCFIAAGADASLTITDNGGDVGTPTPLTTTNQSVIVEEDFENVSGSHTYGYRILNPSGQYTFGIVSGESSNDAHYIVATLTEFSDTHAGFIDTVAIAGKQINAEDSHLTHEQAVLPG